MGPFAGGSRCDHPPVGDDRRARSIDAREQIAAPGDSVEIIDEIDGIVHELDDNQSTIDELAEFLGTEEAIEPRVLEMGRAARV
jgi:hypothetical protein